MAINRQNKHFTQCSQDFPLFPVSGQLQQIVALCIGNVKAKLLQAVAKAVLL